MEGAEHEESSPDASTLLINKLVCSLVGQTRDVQIVPGTFVHRIYQCETATEQFTCNYGLNPEYHDQISASGLKISGWDSDGEVRIVELAGHRFYIATLFLPQLSSSEGAPHPILLAYLKAAIEFRREASTSTHLQQG
jgi:CTP synthase (UTP-ammonia lyase)